MKIGEYEQMMSWLTDPTRPPAKIQTASLMDEYLGDQKEYQRAVDEGFQGTYEEFLQWKSMRETSAQGGVIGKGGMFQGENLGNRTGFRKIKLNTKRKTEYIDTDIQKAYEKYLKTELAKGDMSETLKFTEWRKKNKLDPNLRVSKNLWAEYKNKLLSDLIDAAEAGEKYVEKQDIMKKVTKINKDSTFTATWRTPQNIKKMANMEGYATKVSKVLDNIIKNNDLITTYDIAGFGKGKGTGLSNIKGMIMERAGTTDRNKLIEGLNKNKWYKKNKKAFEYLSLKHADDFTGEKFFDALNFAEQRAGGKTAILGNIKGRFPLPEEYIKSFALRHWEQHNFSGTGKESQITLIDRKTGKPIKWENLPESKTGRKILDASNVDFKIKGSNILWNKANLKKYGPTSNLFKDVYTATQQFNETMYKDVPDPNNPNKTIKFRKLLIDAYKEPQPVALGHDDARGGIKKNPFKNLTLMTRDMNTSLFRAYKNIKNKDLRKQIVSKIFGNLEGKKGQNYLDAFIDNNVERATNIIQKKETFGKTGYRKAATEIVGAKDFLKYSPKKQAEAAKLAGATYKQIQALLQGADKPTIMRIRKALGCMSEGGRVGLQDGGNLLECPMAKFAQDPEGTLNKVGRAVPETRSPIINALKKFGGGTLKWGGRAFIGLTPIFAGMEIADVVRKYEEGVSSGQIAMDVAGNWVIPGAGEGYKHFQDRKMKKDIASPSELAAMQKEDDRRYYEMLQEDPLREADYSKKLEETQTTPEEQFDLFKLMEKQKAAEYWNQQRRKGERAKVAEESTDTFSNLEDWSAAEGGRAGFDEGSKLKNPGRRAFIKGITALAALPIVGKYFKLGKVLERASIYTGPAIDKVKGMPEWFPGLVKKLWNEGEDVTKKMATGERQVIKRGTLEGGDDVDLIYDVGTGDVSINVTPKKGKYETESGAYNKEYSLDYKKGIGDESTKGTPPDEFGVIESRPVRTSKDDIELDWSDEMTVDEAMSDLTELEAFSKNKTTTQIHKKKGTKKKDVDPGIDPTDYFPDADF